jgi:periplasmic protein TonB
MNALVTETEKPQRTTATLLLELEPPGGAPEQPNTTHQPGEHKKHSLTSSYWGDIGQAERPIRQIGAEEAQATFLRGLLDTPTDHRQKNPTDWIISFALHILIVGAVVIAPLAFTQAIDLRNFQLTYLSVPRPPAAAPPSAPAEVQPARRLLRVVHLALLAPTLIPKRIEMVKDPPAPEINTEGVMGGILGGEAGGVLGGIIGGTDHGLTAPPPPPAPKQRIYRVGGVVKPPQPITIIEPDYPPIARAARAEGVVEVDAVIDEQGNVIQARAVSGPGLLMAAAVRAVAQWKYEPTYLDGTPVAIRMQVHVYFHLK